MQDEYDSCAFSVIGYTHRADILLMGDGAEDVLQSLRGADCGLAGRAVL
jgi:hypothetical protein